MEEKIKAKILLEEKGDDVSLVLEGPESSCSYMIFHYYVSCPEFRRIVDKTIKDVMRSGVKRLEQEWAKTMGDGD